MRLNNLIILASFLILVSCSSNGQKKITIDKLSDDQMGIEYAIFLLDDETLSPESVLEKVKSSYSGFSILDSIPNPNKVTGPSIVVHGTADVDSEFTPPDLEYLEYASQGLSEQDKIELQETKYVLILDFVCKKEDLIKTLTQANDLILELTKDKKAVIYDSETRESFSSSYWKENRIITNGSVNLSEHITIHLYPEGDYCRAISLGMLKFGLPDICIENVSCYNNSEVAKLINLTAQTLFEKKQLSAEGELQVNVDMIKNASLKDQLTADIAENAEKSGLLDLIEGTVQDGDPDNRLIEISFPKENPQVAQEVLFTKIFGFTDEVTFLKHDAELLEASARAQETALNFKDDFNKGYPVGTSLLLKFPFSQLGGENEWMWVEVIKWEGESISGLLQNEPQMVTNVKMGEEVSKDFDEMFDYILYHPDGTQEGNETGKIMIRNAN